MEVGKNAENEKLTLLQNVENCFRGLGQSAENCVYNTLTFSLAKKKL
jgi:hypothetical protein